MLGAVLGDFQGQVAGVHDILPDAVDFVAEYEGVLPARLAVEVLAELPGMDRLLHRHQRIAFGPQGGDGVHRVVEMLPGDGILRARAHKIRTEALRSGDPDTARKGIEAANAVLRENGLREMDVPQGLKADGESAGGDAPQEKVSEETK